MKKILVVDDNIDILQVMGIMLSGFGFDVEMIHDGKKVFERIDSFMPDLILLDFFLGRENGGDICKEIKATDGIKHIPVILFSASMADFKVYGADEFIAKPFNVNEMLSKVNNLILK